MTGLSPGHDAALKQDSALVFTAVEIVLPSYTLRLLDGSAEVGFDSRLFVGEDPTYGVLGMVGEFEDGGEAQSPTLRLTVLPPTNAAAATLASVAAQGSLVTIWDGAIDPVTGSVIDEPDPWFVGEIDVPRWQAGEGGRFVELECVAAWERFLRDDEGARLTDAFHQWVWPGELGLSFVTDVQRQLPWGADLPRPAVIRDIPPASGGGGNRVQRL
ncbi:hypothetical protein [Phenylobacterium sp.]|uniref:hypothetical protein n=1 Tax=Phenylobacterium sp. TaxID=1871053 RepID=UPI00394F06CE